MFHVEHLILGLDLRSRLVVQSVPRGTFMLGWGLAYAAAQSQQDSKKQCRIEGIPAILGTLN